MIKLKDILLESTAPDIFVPRRIEDRVERLIKNYIRNGSKGNLSLSGLNLTKLPDILKDISVGGSFFCYNNKLTSLENCPKTVGGYFNCSINELTSLKGAPSSVGRHFYCSNNLLTSLEFAPKSVGGDFHCNDNPVKFTEEQVRAVCDVKGKVYV
jgi:hypothetical protein